MNLEARPRLNLKVKPKLNLKVHPRIKLRLSLEITIKKCDFSKGPIWLKCPHWPKGMVILTKGLGHEKHELFFIKTFD